MSYYCPATPEVSCHCLATTTVRIQAPTPATNGVLCVTGADPSMCLGPSCATIKQYVRSVRRMLVTNL